MGSCLKSGARTSSEYQGRDDLFVQTYKYKYPKATECLEKDYDELMAFFDLPAQHWQCIRTINPIESTFAIEPKAA
jgi:putative transposase